jgi:hypothetical protein
MTEPEPDSGVGRDISVRVGRFECACGKQIVDELPLDNHVRMTMGTPEHPFTQDAIECGDCGREWALVDDGVHWESRGVDHDE